MIIPIVNPTPPLLRAKVTLDDVEYYVIVRWNARSGWYVGLTALDGTVLFPPRYAAEGVNLLEGVTSDLRPLGVMFLLDVSFLHREADFDSLGRTHYLYFLTTEEVLALTA